MAAAAGVSATTVSDALNGRGRVEAGTRARVLQAAEELGYRVNVHARMLRQGRSGILGVMSSLASDSSLNLSGIEYFVDVLSTAATAALSKGYSVILIPPSPQDSDLQAFVAAGALLLDPVAGSSLIARLERGGVPIVSTGRLPDVEQTSGTWVDNDLYAETSRILDLLHERGARRIALLTNPPIRSYAVDTIAAYRTWCAAHGAEPRIVVTDPLASESSAYIAAGPLFASDERPDAIYTPLDRLAVGAMLAGRSAGLSVPDDFLLASGVDSQITRLADPPITGLDLNAREIGRLALELLVDRVEGHVTEHRQVFVPATLNERASTRPR